MKSFQFPLERVLAWRRTQLEIEEARFGQRQAEMAAVRRQQEQWEALTIRTGQETPRLPGLRGGDLNALALFRLGARHRAAELEKRRIACEQKVEEQRRKFLEARRNARLLERLKERRLEEWTAEYDREVEAQASETFLAQWRPRQA